MMESQVMQGREMGKAPSEMIVADMEGLIEGVAEYNNSSNAIGYSVYYYFHNMYSVQGIRSMDIDGVPCTNRTIRDGSYPFTQDFYAMIRRDEPAGSNARKLFDLITGVEGRELMTAAGYIPIIGDAQDKNGIGGNGGNNGYAADGEDGRDGGGSAAVVDEFSKIKRVNPLVNHFRKITGAAKQNLFPLTYFKKTGFVNGAGELAIEPVYDDVHKLYDYDGDSM
jgi:hypothetical protein